MKLLHFGGPSLDVSRARARGLLFDEWPVLVDAQPKQAGEDHGRPFMWSGDGYLPDRIRTRVRSVGEQIDYGPASGHGASMPRSSAEIGRASCREKCRFRWLVGIDKKKKGRR